MRLVTLFVCWQHLSCQALHIGMHPPGRSAARASVVLSDAHWMDYLKFDSAPQFDVLERTKEYAAIGAPENSLRDEYHAKDYVFRGSVIGPITGADVTATQKSFDVVAAYPDLEREMFGFTIDPQNPYKCFFFERWTGTNTASVSLNGNKLQPTGNRVDVPMHISSVVWNPEGQIVYQGISPPVDRFEGVCHLRPMCHPSPYPSPHADVAMLDCKRPPHIATSMYIHPYRDSGNTKGLGAVFALLAGAGLAPEIFRRGQPGDPFFTVFQKLGAQLGIGGKAWSDDKDLPAWWKSSARGADPNDM